MTGHLTEEQLQEYKNRKMQTSELLAIGDHLSTCKECRAKLGSREERAAILEALTRDFKSALLKDAEYIAYKHVFEEIETNLESQHTPEKPSATEIPSPKKCMPRIIWIAGILVLFGLLIAIPFQIQIKQLKAQLKNKTHYDATSPKKQLTVPSSADETKAKQTNLPSN
jgi:hypothetical protein